MNKKEENIEKWKMANLRTYSLINSDKTMSNVNFSAGKAVKV